MLKISIITIVYNDELGIVKTLDSINKLDIKLDVEVIIKDGASNDNTVSIINEKLKTFKHKVIFESDIDNGIYHAMNIAIDKISNDSNYTIFMNSGDMFTDQASDIINEHIDNDKIDVIIFPISSINENGTYLKIRNMGDWMRLSARPTVPHQSTFVKSHLLKSNKYNENYQILSDYDFFCLLYKNGNSFLYIESKPMAIFVQGGVSNQYKKQLIFAKEQIEIQRRYFNSINYIMVLVPLCKWLFYRIPLLPKIENVFRKLMR